MNTRICPVFLVGLLAAACIALAGCASPAFVKEKIESSTPLAGARDERIHAVIETVILRNGPGAWTRDAEWDEYLFRIRALSEEPVEIREIAIFDALGYRIESSSDVDELVLGTRHMEGRYVGAGARARDVVTYCHALVPGAGGFLWPPIAVGSILAGSCITERVNNAAASNEIKRRRTSLPVALSGRAETSVDLFFPRTPRSGRAEMVYTDRHGEHRLDIDMREALIALDPPLRLVSRVDPVFPDEARSDGVEQGYVIAQLTLDSQGRVQDVELIQSVPRRVFDREARRTFRWWRYSEGTDGRTVEVRLEFKR